jgi:glucose/arabinose dehydrogenase
VHRLPGIAGAVVAIVALVGAAACTEPVLNVGTAATALDHPWDLAFLPDGSMLVTERAGRLDRIAFGQKHVVTQPADVYARGEAGMLGIAVDPQFASNRNVFVCMASNAGAVVDVRLVRFTLAPDLGSVTARSDIFTGMPLQSIGRHAGCRPRFGPDGNIWVGTGDAAIGTMPQDPLSSGGKVLRLRRDGSAAPGNPFGLPWYTRGHRNVQGIAFRPSDGLAVSVEQGTNRDDEMNVLRAGGNGGWDPVPGYDESTPMTDLVKFPDAMQPKWTSGNPTIATSGATFVHGSQWGPWDGALVMAALKGQQLRVLLLDANGNVTRTRSVLVNTYGRLRVPVQGPDGNLYVTTDNGGGNDQVLRIAPRLLGR